MSRLETYDADALLTLSVRDLRGKVRAEHAAGNLGDELLLSHGVRLAYAGTDIASLRGEKCIDLLLGKMNGTPSEALNYSVDIHNAIADANQAKAEAPAVPAAVNTQAMAAMNALMAALGGVNPETIKAEIKAQMAQPIADFNSKLAVAQEKVEAAVSHFTKWHEQSQKAVDTLRAEMLAGRPVTIEIKRESGETIKCGRCHYLFPLLLAVSQARCHAYLVGPAGSFKTSTAHKIAKALDLPFESVQVSEQTSEVRLVGYKDAGGTYHPTSFRRCFENGGVFLLDEIDNGNPNVIAVLNAALANDEMGFPDGQIKRHADFILIAAANTYGTGADRLYVGRNELDAATLDRFAFIDFPYDEGYEAELCGVPGRTSPALNMGEGGSVTADGWLSYVQSVRAAVGSVGGVRMVVSPRASIQGVKLAAQGIGKAWLERALIWKGTDKPTTEKVKAKIGGAK